jgi:hypothetical protein
VYIFGYASHVYLSRVVLRFVHLGSTQSSDNGLKKVGAAVVLDQGSKFASDLMGVEITQVRRESRRGWRMAIWMHQFQEREEGIEACGLEGRYGRDAHLAVLPLGPEPLHLLEEHANLHGEG